MIVLESVLVSRGRYFLKQKYLNNGLQRRYPVYVTRVSCDLVKIQSVYFHLSSLSHTSLFLECLQKPQSTFRHTCFSSWADTCPTRCLDGHARWRSFWKHRLDLPFIWKMISPDVLLLSFSASSDPVLVRIRDPSNTSSFLRLEEEWFKKGG